MQLCRQDHFSTMAALLLLPADVKSSILEYFDYRSLSQMECVCSDFCTTVNQETVVVNEKLWRTLCDHDWASYPRYHHRMFRDKHNDCTVKPQSYGKTWKEAYRFVHRDVRRNWLNNREAESMEWYFNYTPQVGGRGKQTLKKLRFSGGFLELEGHAPLPYRLTSSGGKQQMIVAHFPSYDINRLPNNGEWIVTNEYVTFVSCLCREHLQFNGRGFL